MQKTKPFIYYKVHYNNMDIEIAPTKKVSISHYMVIILGIWFVSNLFSQMFYIGIYGSPYDGVDLLKSLGPIYYVIFLIEALLWVWVFIFAITKAIKHGTRNTAQITNIGSLENVRKTPL